MKNKSAFLSIAVLTLVGAAGLFGQAKTPVIDKREHKQQMRIEQGVRSGELTRGETRKLERQEARIKTHEMFAKADGKVSPAERHRLHRELDRESMRIFRKKHNHRTQL